MPDIEERIIRLSEEDGRKLIERLKTQVNGHMTEVVRVNMNAPHEPDIYRLVPRSVAASSSSVVALAEQRAAVVQKRQPRLISVESDVEGHRLINVVAQTQQQLVDRFLRASSVATIRGSGIGGATNSSSKTSLMAPSSAYPYVTYGFGGQELGHHHHQQATTTTNTAAVKYEPTEPLLDDDANNETANARHQQEQYDCSYLMTSSGGRGSSRRLRMNAADLEDREDVKVGPSNTSREYDDARVAQQAVVAGDDDDLAGTCDYLSAKHIRKVCTCTRSRCLKLYCECFANGFFCKHCNCTNCANTLVHETERNEAILATLNRNSAAFRSKVAAIVKGSNAAQSSELVVDDAGVDDHHHRIADQGNSAGIGGLDTTSNLDAAAAAAAKGGIVSSTATGHSGIFKQQTDELQYLRGCNCKKSNCLKNYCECYEARVPCGPYCKCDDCKNTDFGFYVFGDIAFREKPTVFLADVLKKARWLTVEGKKLGKCDSSYLNEELANIAIEGGCVLQPKHHHESDATSSVICEREHVIAFDPKNIMTFTHFSIADKISSYEFAANDNLCEDLVRCFVVRTTDSVMIDMADGTDATSKRQMAILTEFQHLLKTVLKKAKSYQALLSNEQRSIVQHCTTSHNQDDDDEN